MCRNLRAGCATGPWRPTAAPCWQGQHRRTSTRPQGEATPRPSSATRSSRPRGLSDAAVSVSTRVGLAPWPHLHELRPHRSEDGEHSRGGGALEYNPGTHETVICAAWGPTTNWLRNIQVQPARHVQIGRQSFTPEQHFLSEEEALQVAIAFRRRHPWRLRLLSLVLGWGDLRSDTALREFVHQRPLVSFRPATSAP